MFTTKGSQFPDIFTNSETAENAEFYKRLIEFYCFWRSRKTHDLTPPYHQRVGLMISDDDDADDDDGDGFTNTWRKVFMNHLMGAQECPHQMMV